MMLIAGQLELGSAQASVRKGQLTTWAAIRTFIFSGRATFTLVSRKTGTRFTFKVIAKKADVLAKLTDVTFFVSYLNGQDNTADYAYLGVLRKPAQFNFTPASRASRSAACGKVFIWFLDALNCERTVLGTPNGFEFWHEGRCCRCGRTLTVPKSIADGIGPECLAKSL